MNRSWILAMLSVASLMLLGAPSAHAEIDLGQLDLKTATLYSVVSLGSGDTMSLNSGPNAGDFLLGNGVRASFSGGGNGSIAGTLFYDSTVTGTNTFSQLNTPPTTQLVPTSVSQDALASANAVAAYARGLTPTQTFTGTISNPTTFAGNGGINVISVNSIQNAPITFTGGPNDVFVINVSGKEAENAPMTLGPGVDAHNILWNLTGTSGNILQTSGGDTLYGTFLAAFGGNFQFSNLALTGALINTAGNLSIQSGSRVVAYDPFVPVPEPGSLALLSLGCLGATGLFRRRRRSG